MREMVRIEIWAIGEECNGSKWVSMEITCNIIFWRSLQRRDQSFRFVGEVCCKVVRSEVSW